MGAYLGYERSGVLREVGLDSSVTSKYRGLGFDSQSNYFSPLLFSNSVTLIAIWLISGLYR